MPIVADLKGAKYSWGNQEPSQSRANYDKKVGAPHQWVVTQLMSLRSARYGK